MGAETNAMRAEINAMEAEMNAMATDITAMATETKARKSVMRKIYLVSVLVLVGWLTAGAQLQRYSVNFELSERNFVDTIPIRFENDQIYIEAMTDDGELRLLNFDTGSSQGMVYYGGRISTDDELGNIVSRDANGRKDTVKVVRLPAFRLGKLWVSNYVATVIVRPHGRRRFDGILGFDLVNKGLLCKIDVRNGHMILTDRKNFFDGEGGYDVKYKLRWFVPHVWVSPFIRHVDEALFDTGSPPLYSMNKQSFNRHAYKSKNVESQVESRSRGHLAIGNYGAETVDEVVFLNLERLKWGEFSFQHVSSLTTQGGSRVGAALLNYGSLIINPLRKRMTFQPYNGSDTCEVQNRQFNMAFVPVEGRAAVGLIRETCDEYEQGLRQGDVIESINGEVIADFQQFVNYRFVKGETYTLVVIDPRGMRKEIKSVRK